MNKKFFDIKLKYILLGILIILSLIVSGVSYNKYSMSKWNPDEKLIGSWSGKSNFNYKSLKVKDVDFQIKIFKNCKVTGKIGNADLLDCKIHLNRNSFERFIKVKTDYIITDGYLKGKILPDDPVDYRKISMPFNIEDKILRGSMFQLEDYKYPYPFFSKLRIKKD
ncbi:MAG: hypothetical protein ABF289_20400 [Clostridiales bacterium]